MKKNILTLGLFLLAALLPTGCSSDDEQVPETPEAEANIKKILPFSADNLDSSLVSFFNEALPPISILPTESFFTAEAHDADVCYLINNKTEFQEAYKGNKPLPEIDFENYTLIIGMLYQGSNYHLDEQYIEEDDNGKQLVLILGSHSALAEMIYIHYWGIYPKVNSHSITHQVKNKK